MLDEPEALTLDELAAAADAEEPDLGAHEETPLSVLGRVTVIVEELFRRGTLDADRSGLEMDLSASLAAARDWIEEALPADSEEEAERGEPRGAELDAVVIRRPFTLDPETARAKARDAEAACNRCRSCWYANGRHAKWCRRPG
jgi:hypothetical protein